VLRDTVSVAGAGQIIYQFNLDGANIVRRVQPDPGQAILRIEPTGDGMSWVIGQYQSFYAQLTATRLTLNDGVSEPHVFRHDDFPTSSRVTHVYLRATAAQ
jgi:beta-galactosidase GanA